MLFLGVDIGTFESKGVLVDETGAIRATAARAHKMAVPRAGWAEHRADEDWWGDFVFITKDLIGKANVRPEEIAAVATSAIGPCMLPVDAAGRPLRSGVLYGVDTRATAQIAQLNAAIGADRILAVCGNALTSQSVGPKILWLKQAEPQIYAQTDMILGATSYLTFRLTGERVIDHYAAANFSPLYDVTTQDWTDDLAPGILPLTRLPRLMWSTEVAGHVTEQAARETGLALGTPVTCGTIDAAAEAVSVGVSQPGQMMMMYGSTIFIIQVVDRPIRDARLWYAPWLFAGTHASMAGLATSGTLTHWFRDQLARDLAPDEAFAHLSKEAEASPKGARGLLCLPHFSGERTPLHDPMAKGAFFGLNLTHQRGDLYRAVLEGIAAGTAHVLETYAELGAAPDQIMAVGGGVKNAVWLQATSDFSGRAQAVSRISTGASFGDAFLAALAIGAVGPGDIARWNPPAAQITAQPVPAYARQYPLWKRLYAQTRDIARELDAP